MLRPNMLKPNIQLFAEGDADPTNVNGGNNGGGEPGNNTSISYTQEQLDKIVGERTDRATKSALNSFFKQKGLSAEDANKAIDAYLDQKAKNTPDVAQLQSDLTTANSALLTARINQAAQLEALKQGVDLKSIEYVLKLADFSNVTSDDGTIDAEKLTESISKVLTDVPQFKGTQKDDGSNGITKIGGDSNGGDNKAGEAVLRGIFGVKSK